MRRIAGVLLVDSRKWLLLQERDEHAPRFPDVWGMVGGHVEDGEDFETAAYRELEEETGLTLPPGSLRLWSAQEIQLDLPVVDGRDELFHVYTAKVDITDASITVGEGRQIVFVDPARLGDLEMATHTRALLAGFLASDCYRLLNDAEPVTPRSASATILE